MKKLILLLILLIPALAFARFEKLTTDIDQMFARFSGYVVSIDGNNIVTDLGRDKGVYKGMHLKIYRNSEPIIHPITKQVLGNKKIFIGDVEITDVFDKYSNAKVSKLTRSVKPGDIITMNPPVKVQIKIDKVPTRLSLLLREELGNVRNILITDSSPLVLTFTQEKKGGIGYTLSDSDTGQLVYSKYFSDKDLGNAGVGVLATKDILRSKPVDKTYKSMAVGHVRPDGKIYIAAATTHHVDFYIFTGKGFESAGSMPQEFDNIQNIELADLDGDGTDEIFVTQVKYESTVRSSIYQYEKGKYVDRKDNMQYIFRAVDVNGQRGIVAQKLAVDGTFLGMVHNFMYVNGKYERGAAISSNRNVSIYGFGYEDKGDQNVVFSIGKDYKLNVYQGGALRYTSVDQFGQTPYYFLLKNEVPQVTETHPREGAKEDDPFQYESLKKYIKGRVFVNSEGNVYVVQNDRKYKMLATTKIYSASKFAVYSWDGHRLRSMWQSETFQPVISDYYMYEEYGRTYLFLLRNFSDNIFSTDKSQFIYIETK